MYWITALSDHLAGHAIFVAMKEDLTAGVKSLKAKKTPKRQPTDVFGDKNIGYRDAVLFPIERKLCLLKGCSVFG